MTALYSMLYARSGYRTATGELAPDWDAPRNWDAPYWQDRIEAALIAVGGQVRARVAPEERADALLEAFWSAIPDAWLEAQPRRHQALSAEALHGYLLRLPRGGRPALAAMIQVYRTRRQPVDGSQA